MTTTLLTYRQYTATMAPGMQDVTSNAESRVDIWPYVKLLALEDSIMNYVYKNQLVGMVYRNVKTTYDHVLLPTDNDNMYTVIVVDLTNNCIYGHYSLDLNNAPSH